MLSAVFAALVAFAEPVTAVNQPNVTFENWDGEEDLTVYTTEPLPAKPVDPAATQLLWIPTARTLAPRSVRLANNMFVFSQAGVGVTENLQATLSNTLLAAFTGDMKYRFVKKGAFSAAVQGGVFWVVFNKTTLGFGRAIASIEEEAYSLTANVGYGAGAMHKVANGHLLGPGNFWAVSLGGASRLTHYAMLIGEASYARGIDAPYRGALTTALGGVRIHGKQVAFDAGVVAFHIENEFVTGGLPLPWVGLSWLDP